MSLLVKMESDLASVKPAEQVVAPADNPFNASSEALKKSAELPLFAAADLLQQRNVRRRRILYLLLWAAILLLGYFSWQQFSDRQRPVKSQPLHQKIKMGVAPIPATATLPPVQAEITEAEKAVAEQAANRLMVANEGILNAEEPIEPLVAVHVEPQPVSIVSVDLDANTTSVEKVAPRAEPVRKTVLKESAADRDRKAAARANELLASGQAPLANVVLQQVLAENPASLYSRQLYINALIAAGDYTEANAQLNYYRSYHPESVQADYLHARLLIVQQDYRAAINLLASTAAGHFDPDRWVLLGAAYQAAGHWQEAVTSYKKLLGHNRSEPRWWLGLAVAHDALNNVQQARQAYTQVLHYGHNLEAHLQEYAKSRLASL
jgi:tetratricopeptide (TPR) repeat protein